jgi:hypothetical protein
MLASTGIAEVKGEAIAGARGQRRRQPPQASLAVLPADMLASMGIAEVNG